MGDIVFPPMKHVLIVLVSSKVLMMIKFASIFWLKTITAQVRNCSLVARSDSEKPGSYKRLRVISLACSTVTRVTCRISALSALALTGRKSCSRTSRITFESSGNNAPRHRLGRKAEMGVSAINPPPSGMIGPCADKL